MNGPRLSIIPAGAVTDRSLEPRDLQVLCLLGRHTDRLGWCVRSQVKMAVELDCGRASVWRSLERLVDAGWVEKKRRGEAPPEGTDPGHPSASYAYRVVLDRDDPTLNFGSVEASESHAENATRQGESPPVGTPSAEPDASESSPPGAQPDGHPGAQPCVGTGAQPYVGTNNDPLERSQLERERDARARDRKARFLVNFEARWPTAAADDRQRTAYAAEALNEAEQTAALDGIAPFLENLRRLGRKNVPAGWKYLEEKRWTLLEAPPQKQAAATALARDSAEAAAVRVLHRLAGCGAAVNGFMRTADGGIWYPREITPQLLALAQAGPEAAYVALDYRQAGSWNDLIDEFVAVQTRRRLHEGDRAPWPWPPGKDGKIYVASTGPPP